MKLKEGTVMLEISHVTKKYRDKEALSDVSLTIPQGQIVGLLGDCLLYTSPSPRDA